MLVFSCNIRMTNPLSALLDWSELVGKVRLWWRLCRNVDVVNRWGLPVVLLVLTHAPVTMLRHHQDQSSWSVNAHQVTVSCVRPIISYSVSIHQCCRRYQKNQLKLQYWQGRTARKIVSEVSKMLRYCNWVNCRRLQLRDCNEESSQGLEWE